MTADDILKVLNDLGFTVESLTMVLSNVKKQLELTTLKTKLAELDTTIADRVAEIEVERQEITAEIKTKQDEIAALKT